jgi:hypothetical protein
MLSGAWSLAWRVTSALFENDHDHGHGHGHDHGHGHGEEHLVRERLARTAANTRAPCDLVSSRSRLVLVSSRS